MHTLLEVNCNTIDELSKQFLEQFNSLESIDESIISIYDYSSYLDKTEHLTTATELLVLCDIFEKATLWKKFKLNQAIQKVIQPIRIHQFKSRDNFKKAEILIALKYLKEKV